MSRLPTPYPLRSLPQPNKNSSFSILFCAHRGQYTCPSQKRAFIALATSGPPKHTPFCLQLHASKRLPLPPHAITTPSLSRPFSRTIPAPAPPSPMAAETDTQASAVANATGITPSSLQSTLESKLQAEKVFVEDISGGCGQSFEAVIVSPLFEKKTTLARHRLVNAALKEEIAAIHAWTPKCFTPGEWEKRQGAGGG